MRYVRVVDNIAVEIYDSPEGVSIADCFYPTIAAEFVEAPGSIVFGDVLTNQGWTSLQIEQTEQPEQDKQLEQPAPSVSI